MNDVAKIIEGLEESIKAHYYGALHDRRIKDAITKLTQLAEENEKPRLIKIKCEVNETEQDEIVQTLINKIEKESIKAFETNYNEWKVYCEQFQATNTELQGKLAELPDDEEIASIIELNLADIYKEYLDFDDRIFIAQAITDRIKKGKG